MWKKHTMYKTKMVLWCVFFCFVFPRLRWHVVPLPTGHILLGSHGEEGLDINFFPFGLCFVILCVVCVRGKKNTVPFSSC
jgi:hypothetical protein